MASYKMTAFQFVADNGSEFAEVSVRDGETLEVLEFAKIKGDVNRDKDACGQFFSILGRYGIRRDDVFFDTVYFSGL